MNKKELAIDILKQMYGVEYANDFLPKLQTLGPELARLSLEWVFADIYAQSSLDIKTRELLNISALVVNDCLEQLKNHIQNALHVGCTEKEITDAILQMIIIKGFPSVVNAMLIAKDVLAEHENSNCEEKIIR
jgi:4-carboxymuconolactone decarboxylase